jgi:hypothetical protein
VESSSITRISSSGWLWASSESRQRERLACSLRAGTSTEIFSPAGSAGGGRRRRKYQRFSRKVSAA